MTSKITEGNNHDVDHDQKLRRILLEYQPELAQLGLQIVHEYQRLLGKEFSTVAATPASSLDPDDIDELIECRKAKFAADPTEDLDDDIDEQIERSQRRGKIIRAKPPARQADCTYNEERKSLRVGGDLYYPSTARWRLLLHLIRARESGNPEVTTTELGVESVPQVFWSSGERCPEWNLIEKGERRGKHHTWRAKYKFMREPA